MEILLNDYRSKNVLVFSGRDRGELVRKSSNLDELEERYDRIDIVIPEDIISFNTSFFLGMFGDSVRKFKIEGFENKYFFINSERFSENIREGKARALKEQNPLLRRG